MKMICNLQTYKYKNMQIIFHSQNMYYQTGINVIFMVVIKNI